MSHGQRYDQTVARLEEEIEDIKKTLGGNYGTKHGTLLLMELERNEQELRAVKAKRINNAPLVGNRRLEAISYGR
jgi:hypothetical protein